MKVYASFVLHKNAGFKLKIIQIEDFLSKLRAQVLSEPETWLLPHPHIREKGMRDPVCVSQA